MRLVRVLGFGWWLAAAFADTGCKSAAAPHASSDPRVPPHLVAFGDAAEEAFDAADASDWPKAGLQVSRLRGVSARVSNDGGGDEASRLGATLGELEAAVGRKQRVPAMRAANDLTRIGAGLGDRFHPIVPTAVTLLDVLGRDLRIGAEAADPSALAATTAELRRTWDPLKPVVDARGGGAVASQFEAVVVKLEAAREESAFARLAKVELDLVDELENVFRK